MRLIGGAIALALAGFATSVAFAGVPLPPLPTVSTPTLPSVTTTLPVKPPPVPPPPPAPAPAPPPVTVPKLPPAPKPPQPKPPQPVATVTSQAAPVVAPKTSSSSAATSSITGTRGTSSAAPSSGGASGGGTSGGGGSWSTAPTGSSSSSSGSATASRTWIQVGSGKTHRAATIRFVAPSTTRATVTVKQVFPTCVGVGHFTVHAHAGVNSFRLGGRLNSRLLQPGTYRVTVRARSGRLLRRMIVVVVADPSPTARQLAALRAANVCAASAQGTSSTANAAVGAGTNARLRDALRNPKEASAGLVPAHGANLHSGVLASTAEEAARAIQPLLVALLAVAILLLGVASLPREAVPGARVHDTLARHRLELAALGGAALVAVALAFLLS
jgi:hypothetical protein